MISICMATYNGEEFIGEQLDSILSQMDSDDELVISDDSSTDRTVDIIMSYNDKRINLYTNQSFKSPVFNFENVLKLSKCQYVILSDQDDVWKKNKIEIIKKYLNKYDLVLSDANLIDTFGNVISESFYDINNSKKGLIKNLTKNSYIGCTMAFNRKILEKALPFPADIPMHDWWIGLIAEIYGQVHFIDEKLISYRRHVNNASHTGEKSNYTFLKRIMFRLIMIKNLILRCLFSL